MESSESIVDYKEYLNKYQVDYTDPTNFIYVSLKVKMNEFKDINWDNQRILQLYMKHYDEHCIMCDGLNITSFPIYPNMTEFYGDNNQLTSFLIFNL